MRKLPQANKKRVLKEIERRIVEYYLEIDDAGDFVHPPANDDELHEFVEIAFDVVLTRKAVEPGHSSPFAFVADCFFERVKNALAFANRNGGKTVAVAILNCLDMLFNPGCEIASAGAVKNQAKKCYSYFQNYLLQDWFQNFCADYLSKTGKKFITKEIQEETSFANGSSQEILVATDRGLRSPHPHRARIDEVDEIPWNILQTGLSMARSAGGIRGQNVFTSTRQHAHGSMQILLDKATSEGVIKVYEWNIWESVEKCTRRCFADPVHGDCPIYAYCKGKAHQSNGFYVIEDFIDKVRLIDREKFETEWENKKPSRSKLVYPSFNASLHVMTPDRLRQMTGYSAVPIYWTRISGIDFGSSPGHPFVYAKLAQMPTGEWIIFWEYVAEQKLMHEHAAAIKKSPYWNTGERIYADTAGLQERMELKEKRIRTHDAIKDVAMGIDHVHTYLKGFPVAGRLDPKPVLYVWHACTYTIKEFNSYAWPMRPDGKPDKSGRPKQENDHCMDAVRYALYSHKQKPRRKYRTRKVRGV
jgi:hypothetical protein